MCKNECWAAPKAILEHLHPLSRGKQETRVATGSAQAHREKQGAWILATAGEVFHSSWQRVHLLPTTELAVRSLVPLLWLAFGATGPEDPLFQYLSFMTRKCYCSWRMNKTLCLLDRTVRFWIFGFSKNLVLKDRELRTGTVTLEGLEYLISWVKPRSLSAACMPGKHWNQIQVEFVVYWFQGSTHIFFITSAWRMPCNLWAYPLFELSPSTVQYL